MRRESVRKERVLTQRLAVYSELLEATARLADNAITLSYEPLFDVKKTDDAVLDRLISQTRVVASDAVYKHVTDLSSHMQNFNRILVLEAKPVHQILRAEGKVDDVSSQRLRLRLVDVADKVVALHKEIESTIRRELRS